MLEKWLRYKATDAAMSNEFSNSLTPKRFSHQRVDDLFSNAISADKDANYAKYLYMNLSTLSRQLCFRIHHYPFHHVSGAGDLSRLLRHSF